eukprot:CAMPEP_0205944080 /NCGR_PEP_ID=MMETSP1325-20131115/62182_1 /ASSEMBLY_ACC=CAM_ASM_000708 /TAXON_ID=236786 /ORGANISM="Florenciella sp., Strain RCC1007" /LENGTH=36 /DNA_ID= /DNA_START= /DNA_END= /DNA_ORIENTATION=
MSRRVQILLYGSAHITTDLHGWQVAQQAILRAAALA